MPDSPTSPDAEVGLPRGQEDDEAVPEPTPPRPSRCCFCCRCKKPMTALELREENDRRKTMGMPLLDAEEGLTRKEARKRRKEVREVCCVCCSPPLSSVSWQRARSRLGGGMQ